MTTSSSAQPQLPGGAGQFSMTAHAVAAANGSSRMDIVAIEGAQGLYVVGDYFLTLEGRAMIVHPASKTYVETADMAAGALTKMPTEILAQMNISAITGKLEKLDGTESIEGRSTVHYRTTVGYSMSMMGQDIPATVVSDYWIAPNAVHFASPLTGGAKPVIAAGPMAELAKKQMEIMPPLGEGLSLRIVMATAVSLQGQSIVTTITTEMKNITEGDVDASKIALPAGYTKAAK